MLGFSFSFFEFICIIAHQTNYKNMSKALGEVSSGLLLTIYFIIVALLGIFGDLFTFVVGSLIITLVFAAGYNRDHGDSH